MFVLSARGGVTHAAAQEASMMETEIVSDATSNYINTKTQSKENE